MTRFVGLDVSQKITAICVVDDAGRRLWRGQCPTNPEQISTLVRRYAGDDARIGIETGAMTPWLVHELRNLSLEVVCLDARHARAALKMQINKTDQNDAESLAQIVRTGWYRAVHVKSFDSHRARALLGARSQLVGMTTRLSNHIRGVLKTAMSRCKIEHVISLPALGLRPRRQLHATFAVPMPGRLGEFLQK
jgi:transposase